MYLHCNVIFIITDTGKEGHFQTEGRKLYIFLSNEISWIQYSNLVS